MSDTPRGRFVEAMKRMSVTLYYAGEPKVDILQACEAFADAECDHSLMHVSGADHALCRAALVKEVMG